MNFQTEYLRVTTSGTAEVAMCLTCFALVHPYYTETHRANAHPDQVEAQAATNAAVAAGMPLPDEEPTVTAEPEENLHRSGTGHIHETLGLT